MMRMFLLLSMWFCMCLGALMFAKELHCKASDTGLVLSWLAWLFSNLNEDFEWPLSALKLLVLHAEDCISTMMRSQQQLTQEEWFTVVSSGNMFLKGWVQLAREGVESGLPYLAKVRPKHHAFQHVIDFLEVSVSRTNPARDACFMDEDCSGFVSLACGTESSCRTTSKSS